MGKNYALPMSFLVLAVFSLSDVFSCSPGGPDPWFYYILEFDNSTLPDGITIVQTNPVYAPYALRNENHEPFYIGNANTEIDFTNEGLPDGYNPKFKLYDGQVYFFGPYSSKEEPKWILNTGGINGMAAKQAEIDLNMILLDGEYKNIFEDNRPENVEIPVPQKFKIVGFYKGNITVIKGLLTYGLNENYDPKAYEKGVEECNRFNANAIPFGLFNVIAFVLVAGIVIIYVIKNKQIKK